MAFTVAVLVWAVPRLCWVGKANADLVPDRGTGVAPTTRVIHEHRYVAVPGAVEPPGGPTAPPAATQLLTEQEITANLESAFQTNGAKTAASSELEGTIRSSFQHPEIMGVRMKTVECRATRCRAEIDFVDAEAHKRTMRQLFMDAEPEPIPMAMTAPILDEGADGRVTVAIYFYPSGEKPF